MKKFKDFPEFKPTLSPKEMFQLGVFGGGYYRDIKSNITNKKETGAWKEFPKSWWPKGTEPNNKVCDKELNYYKVDSGSSLRFWEKKGWIKAQDPYGWVQWYCRFYQGRRSDDDRRQIDRWSQTAGPNSRFYKWLENMIKDGKDSKKIRQLLIQWAVGDFVSN